jgi:phosphatidylethanolamine-binding protein (PEBP) family uncharacterized protein
MDPTTEVVVVTSSRARGLGAYTLTGVNGNPDAGYIGPMPPGAPAPVYVTDSTHRGRLHITAIDTIMRVVAGSFSFQGIRSDSTLLAVVAGQFRVRYVTGP